MKSDFSRNTFNPLNHFSRVLQQQGRVTLDADGNEQVSILLHYLQTLAKDLIGPHAAPRDNAGFLLSDDGNGGINISPGRYYVDGILIENNELCSYQQQPDFMPNDEDDPVAHEKAAPGIEPVWLYLDVWERHITQLENDAIREKALNGIDTCHRSKVVWQLKAKRLSNANGTPDQLAQRAALMAQKAELEKQLKDLGAAIPADAPQSFVARNLRAVADTAALANVADSSGISVSIPRATPSPGFSTIPGITPAPSRVPTPTATPTNTPAPTATPTATPTVTPEPTQDPKAKKIAEIMAMLEAIKQELAALDAALPSVCELGMQSLYPISAAKMAARINPGKQESGPCIIAPAAQYRGAENHLYRVEIHRGGVAGEATFKWSRENGSVATQWLGTEGNGIVVASARGFAAGDWVELTHDANDLNGRSGVLAKLAKVEAGLLTVDPDNIKTDAKDAKVGELLAWNAQLGHAKVRRWDQSENDVQKLSNGAVPIVEALENKTAWIDLEDGVQVQFNAGGYYQVGDYWLVAARVGSSEIDNWP
ncbi:MAG: hypothetical protein HYZ45_10695, partial [Burkholderiales bacterium]|nr:hypothetical protein [Burkholderiales bacterium]